MDLIPFLATTLTLGTLLGIWLSRDRVRGWHGLGYSLMPFAGVGLGIVFC